MNLYQLTQEAIELASLLEMEELTPELEEDLKINQNELQVKAGNYAKVISNLQADSDAIDNEIKRLKAMKESKDRAISRMKEAVRQAMIHSGINQIESPLFKLSLRRSESVEVEVPEALPVDWQIKKITISADKVGIKKAIKEGHTITGARIVENFNLQIK